MRSVEDLVLSIWTTLQGTNISPKNGILKMIFLFPRWDMLIPWRVVVLVENFCWFDAAADPLKLPDHCFIEI